MALSPLQGGFPVGRQVAAAMTKFGDFGWVCELSNLGLFIQRWIRFLSSCYSPIRFVQPVFVPYFPKVHFDVFTASCFCAIVLLHCVERSILILIKFPRLIGCRREKGCGCGDRTGGEGH